MTAKKADKKEKVQDEIPTENMEDFVLKNEELIMKILNEKRSKAENFISTEKEKGKEFVKGIVGALTDREVTEHFMSMGLEFMMGVGALVKALPWPEEMQPFVDMVSEQKDVLSSVVCKKNPNCNAKPEASSGLERIELD